MSGLDTTPPSPACGGGPALRPYQVEASTAIRRALNAGRHPLYVLPTGGGKTFLFTHIAREYPGRVCILMHRRELIEQTSRALGDTPHGIIRPRLQPPRLNCPSRLPGAQGALELVRRDQNFHFRH